MIRRNQIDNSYRVKTKVSKALISDQQKISSAKHIHSQVIQWLRKLIFLINNSMLSIKARAVLKLIASPISWNSIIRINKQTKQLLLKILNKHLVSLRRTLNHSSLKLIQSLIGQEAQNIGIQSKRQLDYKLLPQEELGTLTKVSGRTTNLTALVNTFSRMALYTQVSIKTAIRQEQVFINIQVVLITEANGRKAKCMDQENNLGLLVIHIEENFLSIKNMAMALHNSLMKQNIEAIISKVNSMVLES